MGLSALDSLLHRHRSGVVLGVALAVLLVTLFYMASVGWTVPVRSLVQERLNNALPPVATSGPFLQTFVSPEPNLSAIEVMLVRYGTVPETASEYLRMDLRDGSSDGPAVLSVTVDISARNHNEVIRFTFPPRQDSEGRKYAFSIDASEEANVSLWSTKEDAYGNGCLRLRSPGTEGDLFFRVYHEYDLSLLARDMVDVAKKRGWLSLISVLVLTVPGLCWLLWTDCRCGSASALSLGVPLSFAAVPVILLWTTLCGFDWPMSFLVVIGLIFVAGVTRTAVCGRKRTIARAIRPWRVDALDLAAATLAVLLLALRLVQTRYDQVPLWVDSVHHTMIAELIADTGQVPTTFRPIMPVDTFVYHYGFHANAALVAVTSGTVTYSAVLAYGQVLNALSVLPIYLLGAHLTRSRLAGIVAMALVGFTSLMPAYYVSWGRYTQLGGMLLLPAAMFCVVQAFEMEGRCWASIITGAMLLAGMLVTHYRVLIFYAVFCLVWTVNQIWTRRRNVRSLRAGLRNLAAMGVLGGALVAPWIWQVAEAYILPLRTLPSRLATDPNYNAMPWELLLSTRNRVFLGLAVGGFLLAILARRRGLVTLGGWVLGTFALLNLGFLWGMATWLVTNASLVISLYVPAGILGGYLVAIVAKGLIKWAPMSGQSFVRGAMVCALASVVLAGAWTSLNIINPDTRLVTDSDLEAIEWIKEETDDSATFLVNSRPWQLDMYRGTDAGWWIPLLAGRSNTLPPVLYTFGGAEYVDRVNTLGAAVYERSPDDPVLLELLREAAVTHVYLGARGGPMSPEELLQSALYRPVYSSGEVWIFEFLG